MNEREQMNEREHWNTWWECVGGPWDGDLRTGYECHNTAYRLGRCGNGFVRQWVPA